MDADTLANILARLTTLTENQAQNNAQPAAPPAPATPRVRAINCKTFCIGQDWGTYSDYLRENIRAAYNLANGDKAPLDAACCSWVGSKLEPGPTLTVYQNLANDIKNNWDRLNDELANLYVDEEQRQLFLANPGAFKSATICHHALRSCKNVTCQRWRSKKDSTLATKMGSIEVEIMTKKDQK